MAEIPPGSRGSRSHPIVPDCPAEAFAGTAAFYARYRVPYPPDMIRRLCDLARVSGDGLLLDLACGPGQIALPMAPHFREVWALDREPEMIEVGRKVAAAGGVSNVRWMIGRAEDLAAPSGAFELITVGSAFHRLHRRLVGQKAMHWLAPGNHLAVMGSNSLWTGEEDWQAIARDVVRRWTHKETAGKRGRHDQPEETFEDALRFAGLEAVG